MADSKLERQDTVTELSQVEVYASRQGAVDLETSIPPLAHHLDHHRDWMERCMKPLSVYPLSDQDYKLKFFRISGLNFALEPVFGIRVWSEPHHHLYCLKSIPLPEEDGLPYTVDCWSYYQLEEIPVLSASEPITRVNWKLKLHITLELPKFLKVLPYTVVYEVGVKVINQVTRTMTDRLTRNVCTDFYQSMGQPKRQYKVISASAVSNDPFDMNPGDPNH